MLDNHKAMVKLSYYEDMNLRVGEYKCSKNIELMENDFILKAP